MKLTKSLLLASVAGFAAVASAQAADLPSKKAAPVEYVKVCPTYGPGFFYIPGTQTCLKIGGQARFEYQNMSTFRRDADKSGIRSRVMFSMDARNPTEYGLVRTYGQLGVNRVQGSPISTGSGTRLGYVINGNAYGASAGQAGTTSALGSQTQVYVEQAFVQIGGFTAGTFNSFYTFGWGNGPYIGIEGQDAGFPASGIAYSASLGSGITLTASLEDSTNRREALNGVGGIITSNTPSWTTTATGTGTPAAATYTTSLVTNGAVNDYLPDAVVALNVAQSWGSAQLSAAVHELRDTSRGGAGASTSGVDYGYAVQGAVRINLPMLAAGSTLSLAGGYSDGATNYTMSNVATATGNYNASGGALQNGGGLNWNVADATVNAAGKFSTMKVWTTGAVLNHFFTPTVSGWVGGSYTSWDWGSDIAHSATINPGNMLKLTTGVTWTPIAGLSIANEVMYSKTDLEQAFTTTNNGARTKENAMAYRLRIARSF